MTTWRDKSGKAVVSRNTGFPIQRSSEPTKKGEGDIVISTRKVGR